MEHVNKLKKLRVISIIVIILVIIAAIAGWGMNSNSSGETSPAGTALLITGIVVTIVFLIIFNTANNKLKKLCTSWGESLAGAAYSWQLESAKVVENKSNLGVSYNHHYVYLINVECPKCGEEKEFKYSFTISPSKNGELVIAKYCKNLFGH